MTIAAIDRDSEHDALAVRAEAPTGLETPKGSGDQGHVDGLSLLVQSHPSGETLANNRKPDRCFRVESGKARSDFATVPDSQRGHPGYELRITFDIADQGELLVGSVGQAAAEDVAQTL